MRWVTRYLASNKLARGRMEGRRLARRGWMRWSCSSRRASTRTLVSLCRRKERKMIVSSNLARLLLSETQHWRMMSR